MAPGFSVALNGVFGSTVRCVSMDVTDGLVRLRNGVVAGVNR